MTDLNYITDGIYITLLANSNEGVEVYNTIAAEFGGVAKFPVHMKPSIFAQIKAAGYTIRKARKPSQTIDEILQELEA